MKLLSALVYGICGNLDLCSWDMVTQNNSRKTSHMPFKMRAVVLVLTIRNYNII